MRRGTNQILQVQIGNRLHQRLNQREKHISKELDLTAECRLHGTVLKQILFQDVGSGRCK